MQGCSKRLIASNLGRETKDVEFLVRKQFATDCVTSGDKIKAVLSPEIFLLNRW